MNEQDLKRAFQDVVVASSPPPAMDPGRALDVARKARSKRRSSLVGAIVAVLVVGIGIGSAFALNPKETKDYILGAGSSSSNSNSKTAEPSTEWGDEWPAGQSDRTAHNGPQAARGVMLLEAIKGSAQAAGYETPALKYADPGGQYGDMVYTQAQVESNKGEQPEIWLYTSYLPIRKDGKVGELVVVVSTPNPKSPTEPCALAKQFWGMSDAGCKVMEGTTVGYAMSPSPNSNVDSWVSYRAANGWTVTIGQSKTYANSGYPAMDAQPFGINGLVKMVTDPKFLLGS